MPSTVTTRAWPCDSPAVRNLSMCRRSYNEESAPAWRERPVFVGEFARDAACRLDGVRSGRAGHPHLAPDEIAGLVARAARAHSLAAAGRHASAARVWREAATALERRAPARRASAVWVMLGRHLLNAGRAADAERVFGCAAGVALAAANGARRQRRACGSPRPSRICDASRWPSRVSSHARRR
jgi:hypothetical protein